MISCIVIMIACYFLRPLWKLYIDNNVKSSREKGSQGWVGPECPGSLNQ